MKSRDQLLELRTGVSEEVCDLMKIVQDEHQNLQTLRANLSNVRCEMPSVEKSIRMRIFQLDYLLVAVWELQLNGHYRWHILKHWSSGKSDTPGHVLLLQGPQEEYVPLDNRVFEMLINIYRWTETPRKSIEDMLFCNEAKRLKSEKKHNDEVHQGWKYLRRLFARHAWGTVGNCWEKGIQLPWLNKEKSIGVE